jgi:hypothetical protein
MPHFAIKSEAYAAIEARFRCDHESRELRLRIIADKRSVYYRQCIRCGNAGRAIAVKEAKLEIPSERDAPPFDDDLEYQWLARKHAEYVKTYQDIVPELKEEYEAYLQSDNWAARRTSTLERANHVCQVCEHFPATQVHHIHYERIGAELDSDLMAVCSFCHGLLHGHKEL